MRHHQRMSTIMNIEEARGQAKLAVALLKSISHESRLMILCDLVEGEKTAGELQQFSQLSQSAFSQHLAVLRKEGLVKARKEGLYVYYSIANQNAARLLDALHELYCIEGDLHD